MTVIIKKLYGFVQLTGLCGVCACVYVFSLSPFLFSLHSDGSNVCFFYTWPCLFGRTYQRRLVGASLPLPAYLSGPVQSGQMPADSLLFSFFFFPPLLSLFLSVCSFFMTSMGGLYLYLLFSILPHFLSLCAASLHHCRSFC